MRILILSSLLVLAIYTALAVRRIDLSPNAPAPFVEPLRGDADLLAAARALGTTIFHPVGTARMGRADDPMAVVDAQLRVRGIKGLRIADASVMPTITSGNTNSPTMMIAEKAARMMLAAR